MVLASFWLLALRLSSALNLCALKSSEAAATWRDEHDTDRVTRQTHRWEQEEARIVAPEALRNCLLHRVDGTSTYDIPPATLQVGFPELPRGEAGPLHDSR